MKPVLSSRPLLLLLAFLILAPPAASAQRNRRSPDTDSGAGFFTLGWQRLELGELNRRMDDAGYSAFSEDVLSLGGMAYAFHQRVLLGVEGQGMMGPSRSSADDAFRTRLMGATAMFDLGYAVYSGRRAHAYPVLGLGGGMTQVQIAERSTPSFDDVLRNPRRGARLTVGGLLVDTSLGVDYRLTLRRDRPGGLAVGIRGGYTFAPLQGDWRLDERNDVASGPDAGLQGPYLRLMIGGWGRDLRRR